MKDLTKEEQEIIERFRKEFDIRSNVKFIKEYSPRRHKKENNNEKLEYFLLSEIRTAVERERERIFTHLVKADMSEFMRNPDRTDPIHKSFYNGTNAMLTILQRYIDSLK